MSERASFGSVRYVDRFLRMNCAADYLAAGVLPGSRAAKEMSESMGALVAVQRILGPQEWGKENVCIIVGDGSTPRTGVMAALLTKWWCVSVDPRIDGPRAGIRRLNTIRAKVEDVKDITWRTVIPGGDWHNTIILGVHSHAPALDTWKSVPQWGKHRLFVNIPCCVRNPNPDKRLLIESYEDEHILSPHCRVDIWGIQG